MEGILVPLGGMAMIVAIVLGLPLVRVMAKRMERESAASPQLPPDVTARLERIEHAVDAVALEVERIAEGQRFTTKLLAERTADREPSRAGRGGAA